MKLVVVGGGISGLAAAWFAADAGHDVTVLEAAAQVGGKLRVEEIAGVPVDVGAEAMLATRPEGVELVAAAGLAAERVEPRTTSAAIWTGGRGYPLPARTMLGIPSSVAALRESGALSESAIAAVAAEPDRAPLPPLAADLAVGALVRSRLGDEVLERLVDPLLGGVYAGRADQLSLRATMPALAQRLAGGGSLVEAARAVTDVGARDPAAGAVFTSLRGGLGRLPEALAGAGRFAVRTGVTVRMISRTAGGFVLDCGAVPVSQRLAADAVVVAAPAGKAARLLAGPALWAAAELAGIESASMAIVSFAFAFADAPVPIGSGLLVGAGERLATKAVTISSQKWPLDTELVLLRASVGRLGESMPLRLPDEELIALVHRELRPLLGIEAAPVDALVTRWGGGLPQYAVGHVERITRLQHAVAAVPGLAICGAYLGGVGIPACIASARAAVDRVGAVPPAEGQ